jgi:hypothetical protein
MAGPYVRAIRNATASASEREGPEASSIERVEPGQTVTAIGDRGEQDGGLEIAGSAV